VLISGGLASLVIRWSLDYAIRHCPANDLMEHCLIAKAHAASVSSSGLLGSNDFGKRSGSVQDIGSSYGF